MTGAEKWTAMEWLLQWRTEGKLTEIELRIAVADLAAFDANGFHCISDRAMAARCSDPHQDGVQVNKTQVSRAKEKLVALGFKRVKSVYAGRRRVSDNQYLEDWTWRGSMDTSEGQCVHGCVHATEVEDGSRTTVAEQPDPECVHQVQRTKDIGQRTTPEGSPHKGEREIPVFLEGVDDLDLSPADQSPLTTSTACSPSPSGCGRRSGGSSRHCLWESPRRPGLRNDMEP